MTHVLGRRQNQHEITITDALNGIVRAKYLGDTITHDSQQAIAYLVAEGCVEFNNALQMDQQHTRQRAVTAALVHVPLQFPHKSRSILFGYRKIHSGWYSASSKKQFPGRA